MKLLFTEIFDRYKTLDFFQSEETKKTYFDFQKDIANKALLFQSEHLENSKVVVKNSAPYLFLIEVFALWSIKKVPILISSKNTPHSELALVKQIPLNEQSAANEALILFTSGSTNFPKGVSLTFSNLNFQAETFAAYFKAAPSEVYFLNLPLNHVGGLMLCLRAFFSGGKISTDESLDFSYISLVPHQLDQWINNHLWLKKLKSAKAILIGGAPLSSSLKNRTSALSLPIYETYGMTETTSFVTINGKVLPNREVKINSDGVISIKGPMVAAGYYVNQKFQKISGWLETNDVGFFDHENIFFPRGRKDSVIISGGENISPFEIENHVMSIPGIKKAHVTSIPDEKWGEVVTLLYESADDKCFEIKKILSEHLHPYHVPKFLFNTILGNKTDLKISIKEMKNLAYELYLKNIFSHTHTFVSSEKPTLVILHGFMEDKEDWEFLAKKIKSYNVLTVDLPGHGKTEINPFSSLHEILTRLRDFILLFTDRPILLGYSMGGRIAIQISENYLTPEKLILISTSFGLHSKREQEKRLEADLKLFNRINDNYSLKDFFVDWYSTPMFLPFQESKNFEKEINKKIGYDYKNWSLSLKFFSQGNFPLKKNMNFSYPLFYISGSEDEKYSKIEGLENHYLILGAGHNPHKTHTEQLSAHLLNIL